MKQTFWENWWYNGKYFILSTMIGGTLIGILLYLNQKEVGWWFTPALCYFVNLVYVVGMYISWRKRIKNARLRINRS